MAGFAKIAVMGFLGGDPDTKYTPNGAMVVSFSIAVNSRRRSNQQQSGGEEPPPTWYRISAWDRLAERLDRMAQQGYIVKGRPLYVEGSFEPREFTGNDGATRISYDINLTDFQFVSSERQQDGQGGGANRGSGSGGSTSGSSSGNSRGGYDDSSANRRSSTFNDDDAPNNMDDVPF
jgi:single-strand DNA-binding protein